ncbi:hypothetical protein GCM10022395_24170 [Snuella lapsa]|uniref:Signal transduction histidine kinase internal region domain-containing protein n=2 Tax=Snuella lapsa TaxID=870481 RepID=A0ABP6XXZ3_9FLAO
MIFSVLVIVIEYTYMLAFYSIVKKESITALIKNTSKEVLINNMDYNFLTFISILTITYIYFYFKNLQEIQSREAMLKTQLANTRLQFLQAQMHPHFLFNTLNSIYTLADINIKKSKDMLVNLSALLREVLDKNGQNVIELQEELDLLYKYIEIKKIRFSEHLKFQIYIDDNLENVLVPSMVIQPIVENSIKHGFSKDNPSLMVYISIYKQEENLIVKVKNNGKRITQNFSELLNKGTGIKNLDERLKELYGHYSLNIYNSSGHVITEVVFPLQVSVSELVRTN